MRLAVAFIAILVFSNTYAADEEDYCSGMTGIERTNCLERMQAAADKDLDAAYAKMFGNIEAAGFIPQDARTEWAHVLRSSREKWLAYRSQLCSLREYDFWGAGSGSAVGNAVAACTVNLTLQQTKNLLGQ